MTEQDFRPPRRASGAGQGARSWGWIWVLVLLAAAVFLAWHYRSHWWPVAAEPPAPIVQPAPESAVPVPEATPSSQAAPEGDTPDTDTAAATAAPLHPLDTVAVDTSAALATPEAFDQAVVNWLGQSALKFLVLPGLAQHVVATIDNLPRSQAPVRMWPVAPVGGQMQLLSTPQGQMIAPDNSQRYDALVGFLTAVNPAQAAAWYRQAYPVLQSAYEALGYPGQYFNDRVVQVMDHLLQTPEPAAPLEVTLVQVQGQVPSLRPWVRYEFADAALQSLSAGQKIMLRVGPQHRQHLRAYLQALRAQIAQ